MCCRSQHVDCCIWLGLEHTSSGNALAHAGGQQLEGMKYNWDTWSNGCGSGFRNWDQSQPNGGIDYYSYENQGCVVMGFCAPR